MCQPLTVTRLSAHRLVVQCSCGSVHLMWDHATLSFRQLDFLHVVRTLCELQRSSTPTPLTSPQVRLVPDPTPERVQLWLVGVGFCLSQEELRQLTEMLSNAAKHVLMQTHALSYEACENTDPRLSLN